MSDEHTIIKKLDEMMKTVTKIERGVYGDEDNELVGLIDHRKEHDKRIKDLEETKKKAVWFAGGAILVLQVLWHSAIDFFKKL